MEKAQIKSLRRNSKYTSEKTPHCGGGPYEILICGKTEALQWGFIAEQLREITVEVVSNSDSKILIIAKRSARMKVEIHQRCEISNSYEGLFKWDNLKIVPPSSFSYFRFYRDTLSIYFMIRSLIKTTT